MKRFIKVDASGFITDIFNDTHSYKFDGTEIYLDDEAGVHIDNRCIFDEFGNKIFKYIDSTAVKIDENIYLAMHKSIKVTTCSEIATQTIYEVYPSYKQQNMITGANDAMQALALELGISIEQIGLAINKLVLQQPTLEKLLIFREIVPILDLSEYVVNSPSALKVTHIAYFKIILTSIVGCRIIKYVRDWCNAKQAEIQECKTIESLEKLDFKDCPVIKSNKE